MTKSMAAFALIAGATVVALVPASSAQADGARRWQSYPQRSYRPATNYYRSRCAYGDCACIRQIALATASQVWWDRYQACTGG